MSVGIKSLFTSALGLQPPWAVGDVKLDTAKRRIDFEVLCQGTPLACAQCGGAEQRIHGPLAPLVAAPGLLLVRGLAACRCAPRGLHWLQQDHADMSTVSTVRIVGIDHTGMHRGQSYITVAHDLDAKRLQFSTPGRDNRTVEDFAADLKVHGGDPEQVLHVCQDMSAAYALGVGIALLNAQISYDRFHVVALAADAMDRVRQAEMRDPPMAVAAALSTTQRKTIKGRMWGMRTNPDGWTVKQTNPMHWHQYSGLKCARAWRLKMALREVYAHAAAGNDPVLAMKELKAWLSWARRSRLEPFKKLARTITERIDAVVPGMTDNRSNALVEAMNGLLQQARARCARLQNCIHLHRYRLPAPLQAQALAPSSVRASPDKLRISRSTRNGIELQNDIF